MYNNCHEISKNQSYFVLFYFGIRRKKTKMPFTDDTWSLKMYLEAFFLFISSFEIDFFYNDQM